MARNRSLFVRLHARLHDDERGFSLLETVIAITVIFGSLITLAMSASTGFRYVGIGREQQAANQIANQLMEQARGLAFTKITQGLQTSDLSTDDPNLVTGCMGDDVGVYRFATCDDLPGTDGDRIVSTNLDCPTPANPDGTRDTDCSTPLVPNLGTIGASDDYPVDYEWHTYVTNNCTSATGGCEAVDPYRVTVIIEWAGAGTALDGVQRVTTESLFHSPRGCVSSQTHPFAAPCQPFFYGQALAPVGRLTVSGTVSGVDFGSGAITTTGADSAVQIEQVSSVQGTWTQTGTELTTSAGTSSLPADPTSGSTAADSDPSGTTPGYSSTPPGQLGAGSNQFASGGGSFMQVQNAANDTGQAISATQAGGANTCPPTPPAPPQETDLQPCGGANARQAGTARIVGYFRSFATDLGDATIVSLGAPASHTTTFANRILVPGVNGNLQDTASRSFGTLQIGGLPDLVTPPIGWLGHFMQLTSYRDVAQSTAGTNAAAPSATITSGVLSYWNGLGYTSIDLSVNGNYSLTGLMLDHTTVSGDGHLIRVRIAPVDGTVIEMESPPATSSTPPGGGSIARTEAQATIGSPILGTFDYEVWIDGLQVVDLTIDVALGTLTSKSLYEPAPSAGE